MTIQDLIQKWENDIEMSEKIYKETGHKFFETTTEANKRCLEELREVEKNNEYLHLRLYQDGYRQCLKDNKKAP